MLPPAYVIFQETSSKFFNEIFKLSPPFIRNFLNFHLKFLIKIFVMSMYGQFFLKFLRAIPHQDSPNSFRNILKVELEYLKNLDRMFSKFFHKFPALYFSDNSIKFLDNSKNFSSVLSKFSLHLNFYKIKFEDFSIFQNFFKFSNTVI